MRVTSPLDGRLFGLFSVAVQDCLMMVANAKASQKYIGKHSDWSELSSFDENGMPSFSESLDAPLDYSTALQPGSLLGRLFGDKQPDLKDLDSVKALLSYFSEDARLKSYCNADKEHFFASIVYRSVGDIVDRYVHECGSVEFSEEKLLPIYLPIERFLLCDELDVEIWVPILSLRFDVDEAPVGQRFSIKRMPLDIQLGRVSSQRYNYGHHPHVQSAATHALVMPNYSVPNKNWFAWAFFGKNQESYPVDLVDIFFCALRLVTGFHTGFAQLLLRPIGWASGYNANRIPFKVTSVRKYPRFFEDSYWNKPVPEVTAIQLADLDDTHRRISDLVRDGENPRIKLACQRMNLCYLREDDDDAIVDATVALETLLSDTNQEMTYKLAMRVAALSKLGRNSETPKDIFDKALSVYKYRSAVVHGNADKIRKTSTIRKGEKEIRTIEVAIELLRMTLRVLLWKPEFLDVRILDRDLLLNTSLAGSSTEAVTRSE